MAKRTVFWVMVIAATLGAAVAVTARSSRAESAADECLSKPNAPSPQGSHWYYRSDRAANRRCWFLAPQGEKVSQAAAPKPRPSAKPTPQPQAEPPVETIAPHASMLAAPVPWLDLPTSTAAIESKPAPASDNDADAPSEMPPSPEEEMPLIWPVLTAADLAAAEASPVKSEHVLVLAAAALVLAAIIVRKIFKLFAVRRIRRRRSALRDQWDSAARASGLRKPVAPAFAARLGGGYEADDLDSPPLAPRPVDIARSPAPRRNPGYDFDDHAIEDPEIEASLQRLLHDWRRAAA